MAEGPGLTRRLAVSAGPAVWPYRGAVVAGGLGAAWAVVLMVVLAAAALGGLSGPAPGTGDGVSGQALRDIPPAYLSLYQAAAQRYGLDWAVLAGIGKVECDHGRDPAPACTVEGATNGAGAGGPAQFLAATWRQYGVSADASGPPDRWKPADAIFGMANYLRASGAPSDYRAAIYAYNHADWYVAEVQHWAALYRGSAAAPALAPGSAPATAGSMARLDPSDGHVALAPADAPVQVSEMIGAGNALQNEPYGPAGHPDPRGASSQDCSSSVNYVLYRAGLRSISEIIRDNPLAQSYPQWGLAGPGRWVTVYATTYPSDHVFIVIAGLRLDTSHRGTDVGPNRDQDGPRWRIFGQIPAWAHWSVRHPPGL